MKTVIKVILVGLLVGLMPTPAQALSLPTPCALIQKYPRLASFAAVAGLGLSIFAAYKWLSQKYSSSDKLSAPKKDAVVSEAHLGQGDDQEGLEIYQELLKTVGRTQISSIAMHNNGNMFAISSGRNVCILNQDFVKVKTFPLPSKTCLPIKVRAFAFHPTKPLLAMQCGFSQVYVLYMYNYQTEELIEVSTHHKDSACFAGMAFSPDGKLLVTSSDEGRIVFWKIDEQNPMQLLLDYEYKIDHAPHYSLNLSFNTSGTRIAIGSSMSECKCCMVIDVASKEVVFQKSFPDATDVATIFHPIDPSVIAVTYCDAANETLLACQLSNPHNEPLHSSSDKSIEIINIDTHQVIKEIKNTQGGSLIAFNHDGTRIACRNNNSDIEIYDCQKGEKLFNYARLFREMYASILFDKKGNCITSRAIYTWQNYKESMVNLHIMAPQEGGYNDRIQPVKV